MALIFDVDIYPKCKTCNEPIQEERINECRKCNGYLCRNHCNDIGDMDVCDSCLALLEIDSNSL